MTNGPNYTIYASILSMYTSWGKEFVVLLEDWLFV